MKTNIILIAVAAITFASCGNEGNKNRVTAQNEIFPKGEVINNDYFTGTAYLQWLMTNTEDFDASVGFVTFEPGCRNNWHSHPGGQLLLVTSGEGYYQEEGKSIQLIKTGDVVEIRPNVMHWHGATPYSEMAHIAVVTRTSMGGAVWGGPVTDRQYNSYNQ